MKKLFALMLAVIMTFSMVACGSKTEETKAPENNPGTEQTQEARTYYYIAPYMGHPYIYDQILGFKYAAEKYNVNIIQSGPDGWDTEAAAEAFEQAIAKKPDGIVTVMWDGSLVAAATEAEKAGIPVICIETTVEDNHCLTYIGLDNLQCGKDTAKALVETAGESGKLICQGNFGASNTDLKLAGVKEYLANYPGWEILAEVNDESDTEKAIETAKTAVNNYPDATAFVGLTSASGPGIAQAMEELNKQPGEITIVCNDREDMTLEYVEKGYIAATLCNKTAMQAYLAIDLLEAINTKGYMDVPLCADNAASGVEVLPETITTGCFTITKDNVAKFLHDNMGTYDTDLYKK